MKEDKRNKNKIYKDVRKLLKDVNNNIVDGKCYVMIELIFHLDKNKLDKNKIDSYLKEKHKWMLQNDEEIKRKNGTIFSKEDESEIRTILQSFKE